MIQLKWWEIEVFMSFEHYELSDASLVPKPFDVSEDCIAYNPSAIWTVESRTCQINDIVYVRVEPDKADDQTSHLGKSRSRPYIIDPSSPETPLVPYDIAEEKDGEDPALTRISRRLANGAIQKLWLLSCVNVQTFPFKPNEIRSIKTRFYIGEHLDKLEHLTDGPEDMKDIRIAQSLTDESALHVYGRPRAEENSGNITYTSVANIEDLDENTILQAPVIDERLFPAWGSTWGGVNYVVPTDPDTNLLVGHRAWKVGKHGRTESFHYETVMYGHNIRERTITDLGVLATARFFPSGPTKNDSFRDVHDVVFPGGGYNGDFDYMTFGVRDASIGIGKIQKT